MTTVLANTGFKSAFGIHLSHLVTEICKTAILSNTDHAFLELTLFYMEGTVLIHREYILR